jgi:hypothetical protein
MDQVTLLLKVWVKDQVKKFLKRVFIIKTTYKHLIAIPRGTKRNKILIIIQVLFVRGKSSTAKKAKQNCVRITWWLVCAVLENLVLSLMDLNKWKTKCICTPVIKLNHAETFSLKDIVHMALDVNISIMKLKTKMDMITSLLVFINSNKYLNRI